ncbi:MAG: hypothetical protein ACR2RF_01890 [Geminicoccaceae bacterium]
MIYCLIVLLVITFVATYWANRLAYQRKRHVGGWSFATAMLPPLVLILWALPARAPT